LRLASAVINTLEDEMSSELSRRSLVTTAAALPALAMPAAAVASTELDPVFAVIEDHRRAYIERLRTGAPAARARPSNPEYKNLMAAEDSASDLFDDATETLAKTQPTTVSGVLALLAYMEEFHLGEIYLPEDRRWSSSGACLSFYGDVEDVNGEPLPFLFYIMRNVRAALQSMAVRS
jgi:hypothetical protein